MRAVLLCPVCNTSAGADVRAGIVQGLLPLLAMAVVLVVLVALTLWIHRRAPLHPARIARPHPGRELA